MPKPSHHPAADRTWPKTYLLNVYKQALDHGAVVLSPITAEAATSLKAALYRQRRRSDNSNKTFITPEMHLVTVGRWHSAAGGSLPIYYTSVPDTEEQLPDITPLAGGQNFHIPDMRHLETSANYNERVDDLDNIDAADYVSNLILNAKKGFDNG